MCSSIGQGPQGLPSWPQGHRHFPAQLSSFQILLSCPSPPVTVTQWMIYPFESYENCFLFYSTAEVQSGLLSSKSLSTKDAALQHEIYSWKSPSSRCQSHLGWQTFFFPFGMKQSLIHLRQYLVCGSHGSWQPITLGFAMKRLHISGIWDGVKKFRMSTGRQKNLKILRKLVHAPPTRSETLSNKWTKSPLQS